MKLFCDSVYAFILTFIFFPEKTNIKFNFVHILLKRVDLGFKIINLSFEVVNLGFQCI